MLSGEELGSALARAMALKGVKQGAVAQAFGVSQPSVSEWISLGRIHKKHIPTLLAYFAEVVGPDHWGLPFSREEFALILAFRKLHPDSQKTLLKNVQGVADSEASARELSEYRLQAPTVIELPATGHKGSRRISGPYIAPSTTKRKGK